MLIPSFNETGVLPPGVHDCTVEEIEVRFGRFHESDRRPQLWTRLKAFIELAAKSGLVEALIVDGSFVTDVAAPNDVDLVVILPENHDLGADLSPDQYNLLAQARVRRQFGFDILVVKSGTGSLTQAIEFFEQVRQRPGAKKGLLRIKL